MQKTKENEKEIWLAGGCFWGVEAAFGRVPGVLETEAGYANGRTANPGYHDLAETGHAETVRIKYDSDVLSLTAILCFYFRIIDPTTLNRQGGDTGTQYRTGIFYLNAADLPVIQKAMARVQTKYELPLRVLVEPLEHFYPAEDYHQRYLEKNSGGYCHVNLALFAPQQGEWQPPERAPEKQRLRETLPALSYAVTQQNGTEPPFENAWWDNAEPGLYVDIITGEPLFSSADQFDSGCGWPSFTNPLPTAGIAEQTDESHGMVRTEVRAKAADSHLGHVFDDGPKDAGGLRYCINSAALRFIPCADLLREGYGRYLRYIR